MSGLWLAEHDSFMTECFSQNMSCAITAEELNLKFGTKYTRCSVIGRAKRKGIPTGKPPSGDQNSKQWMVKAKGDRSFRPKRFVEYIPIAPPACEPVSLDLDLLDVGSNQCHYPHGDGPFRFCGHPIAVEDKPYCGFHMHITIGTRC